MYKKILLLISVTLALVVISQCYPTRIVDPSPNDPRHMKSHKKSTVNFSFMILLIIFSFSAFLCAIHKFGEMSTSASKMLSSGMAGTLLLTVSLTENAKKIVGRPRPDFFDRIKTDGDGKYIRNAFVIEDGRKSFPSGHTSTSFCAASFFIYTASLYFHNRKVIIMLSVFTLLLAASVGCTRVFDNRHFTSDVLVGALVGVLSAAVASFIIDNNKKDWL